MNINDQLSQIGLNKSEIAIYLYILENGLSTPPKIAKGTGIVRTNCYHVLQQLKERGLLTEQETGKRKAYLARDPQALLSSLERRHEAIEKLLPDLRALYSTQKNKPKIRFYEGFKEVQEIYAQTLSAKKIYGLGSTKRIAEIDQVHLNNYMQEVGKRGIVFIDILSHASGAKEAMEWKNYLKGLYEYRLAPAKYGDFPTDMLFWDDNIAMLTLEEPIFGTVIASPLLAETFHIIFNIMWEALPPVN